MYDALYFDGAQANARAPRICTETKRHIPKLSVRTWMRTFTKHVSTSLLVRHKIRTIMAFIAVPVVPQLGLEVKHRERPCDEYLCILVWY